MSEPVIIVCYSQFDIQNIQDLLCPTCKTIQPHLCQHQEWYGWLTTCLNCGDSWSDGELCERPFRRGWRKEAIAYAHKRAVELGLIQDSPK